MSAKCEGPTTLACVEGPDSDVAAAGNCTKAEQQEVNQPASLLRARVKVLLRQASTESALDNIRRQLQLLQHQRPCVLQAMLEPFEPGKDWKPFMSALCDSAEMASQLVRELESKQQRHGKRVIGFFVVMNEVSELHTQALQLGQWCWTSKNRGTSTTDRDIEARLAMFVDFDPFRQAFELNDAGEQVEVEVNSTNQQLQVALKAALDCCELLTAIMLELGIDPSCMSLAVSGNGAHLVILLDRLPNDAEVARLVRDILYALAKRYDQEGVLEVDTKVCDAKRICPLYGTMKRKGQHTPATPHRQTFITESSGQSRIALAQLRLLRDRLCPMDDTVEEYPRSEPPSAARTMPPSRVINQEGHTAYGAVVLDRAMHVIATAAAGHRHHTILRAAYNVGGFVSGGELRDCLQDLLAVCPDEHKRTCEDGYKNGLTKPRSAPERYCGNVSEFDDDSLFVDPAPPPEQQAGYDTSEPAKMGHRYEVADGVQWCVVDRLADRPVPAAPPKHEQHSQPATWKPLQPLAREDHPLPQFPVDVLPLVFRVWVRELSHMVQQPYDIAATMGIASMATALQRTHTIQVHAEWTEEVSTYATAVAPSGSNKSKIEEAATRPIRRYEQQCQESFGRERAAHKVRRKALEHQLQTLGKDGDEEAKIELQFQLDRMDQQEPQQPQLISADATQESLIDVLSAQRGSIGLLTPEGKQIYSLITGRYSEQHDCKIELLLLGWGETYVGNRRNKDQKYISIPNMRISIGNSIQPEYVHRMIANGELRGSGLMGRFLISYPQSTLGWRATTVTPMRDGVQDAYDNTITTVLCGQPAADGLHVIRVSDEAIRELERYRASFEQFLREGGRYEEMTSWMAKSCGFALKLAALMQAFEQPSCPHEKPISTELIRRANVLVDYYREHFLRLVLRAHSRDARSGAEKLVEWARKTHAASAQDAAKPLTFRPREAQQHIRALKEKADLEFALEQLADRGYIRITQTRQKPPRVLCEWNPAVFEPSSTRPDTLPEPSSEPAPTVAEPVRAHVITAAKRVPGLSAPNDEEVPAWVSQLYQP